MAHKNPHTHSHGICNAMPLYVSIPRGQHRTGRDGVGILLVANVFTESRISLACLSTCQSLGLSVFLSVVCLASLVNWECNMNRIPILARMMMA